MKQHGFAPLLILIFFVAIGIAGYLSYKTYFSIKNQPITLSSPAPSETPDPTANWKTYTDSSNRFSFKYPSDQVLEKNNGVVGLYGPDFILFEVKLIETTENDPDMWWSKQTELLGFSKSCFLSSIPNLNIGSKKITLLKETGADNNCLGPSVGNVIVASFNNHLYQITYNNSQVSNQTLSTFKFLGQYTDNSNNKTYQTSDGSFTMNYPSDWTINDKSKQVDFYNNGKFQYEQNITLSKDGYSLNSYNPIAFGPSVCLFPDSPSFDGPSVKYTDFKEFSGPGGLYRRVKSETQDQTGKLKWFACRKDPNSQFFATVAGFGITSYETPVNFDLSTLETMDKILSSITHIQK